MQIARQLGIRYIHQLRGASGDAVPGTPAEVLRNNFVRQARDGAIILMHMNHPQWHMLEGLAAALPQL